ncbi:MAG: hypothetical protein HOJ35_01440 [Bdellovibrionales bacterium]|nr:hypothetical protein [Bdellovibrionales bacterium]
MQRPLRKTNIKKEIIKTLQSILNSNSSIIIWQCINEKKEVKRCIVYSLNIVTMELIFVPRSKNLFIDFCEDHSIFLYSNQVSMLFKSNTTEITNNTIKVKIPKLAYLLEKRSVSRSSLSLTEPVYLTMTAQYINDNYKIKSFKLIILDISDSGVSVKCNLPEKTILTKCENISINGIYDIQLNSKIIAKILYNNKQRSVVNNKLITYFKIGLSLNQKIPKYIINKCDNNKLSKKLSA